MLSDEHWESLAKLMKSTGRVYDKREHRLTLEGILYRMGRGCPWRDLPRIWTLEHGLSALQLVVAKRRHDTVIQGVIPR
jgi:transposase